MADLFTLLFPLEEQGVEGVAFLAGISGFADHFLEEVPQKRVRYLPSPGAAEVIRWYKLEV